MRKIISTVLTLAIVIGLSAFFGPKLLHTCDDCEEFFVGLGYEPNSLLNLIEESDVLCKDCAEKHHAVEIALGKELDEYRKPLF